ncbi:hypothetical protein VTL71DRAFT_6088 [Oculimacula yallundae]|uniref:Uncharacterized protein n=1 Tax=Oculimacula yallundae TaxID=86028 RepID=A0ABR4C0U8_9HELO
MFGRTMGLACMDRSAIQTNYAARVSYGTQPRAPTISKYSYVQTEYSIGLKFTTSISRVSKIVGPSPPTTPLAVQCGVYFDRSGQDSLAHIPSPPFTTQRPTSQQNKA